MGVRARAGWGARAPMKKEPELREEPKARAHVCVRARPSAVALVADARGLAPQVAQVKQPRSPHHATRHDLDLVEAGGVDHERALDAHAKARLAHRDGAAGSGAMPLEHDALEHLHAELV